MIRALPVGLALLLAATAEAADAPSPAEIRSAIERGIAHLRDAQRPDGSWRYNFNADQHTLGMTALAGLAMLENNVPRDDPAVARASEAVHTLVRRSDMTYDLALAILFLARSQAGSTGPEDELIRTVAGRLERGEREGMWTYTVPTGAAESGPSGRRRRRRAFGGGDNSNTQFALLGLWGAGRHGFDSNESLEAIDRHFRGTQNDDGGWGYVPGQGDGEAMSCAGLMGLAIAAARPALAERQTARARGAALAADPAFVRALATVARHARAIGPSSEIYYLWSLERVCVALGLRDLDGLDWYARGAGELLRRARDDGSWPDERWGSLPNTCLALLFLRKANLAFELDRVLRLPGPGRPERAEAEPAPESKPIEASRGTGGVEVVVRGVSDRAFPVINLDFEVKNPDGSARLDAQRDDFRVTEYDQPVEVLDFQGPKQVKATTVVLVVDRSLSMKEEDRIGGLKAAVATFLKQMPKGSRVAVIAFGSEVRSICPFTDDPRRVQAAVDALTPAGATRYYDAVGEAIQLIGRESGRRAVLALTDGEDTFSQSESLESAIAAGRREGVPVHALGLGSEDEIESDALRKLADGTRGRYFPAREAAQLRGIYEELARGLGATYHLSYRSDRQLPDGTLRPIRLYFKGSRKAAEAAVFIPGMVVPASGWSRLFLLLVSALAVLALAPGRLRRRVA